MAISKASRAKVETKVYETLSRLDPTKKNAEKYKKLFKAMNDKEFEEFFKKMSSDFNNNFYAEIDLYSEKPLGMESIQSAASYLKLPLEEYVTLRHNTTDGKPVRSKFKVPVLYIHVKRMQQILSKKNRMNIDIMKAGGRSKTTGSIRDFDRTGRLTDGDLMAILAATNNVKTDRDKMINLLARGDYAGLAEDVTDNPILREILGGRADNISHKLQMNAEIANLGTATVSDFTDTKVHSGQALNTLDIFLIGAGLKADLVTGNLYTMQGIENLKNSEEIARQGN